MAMMERNIFEDIIERKLPAKIVHDDDICLAFEDIHPAAPTHILIIPKKCVRTHADIELGHQSMLGHLHLAAKKIAAERKLESYRIVINCNEGAGQSVPHLHLHLLGGRPLSWPPG